VEGRREFESGATGQYQVNPLHVYEDHRPRPFRESAPSKSMRPVSAFYLKIKSDARLEGVYGPVDREAAIVVQQQLRRFVTGKDALAQETLWDLMHRSNRHSRRGHFMMAISAVDNTLWDLRARYFGVPVYRLLGGPSRAAVDAYASCLGFSIEPEPLRRRAVQFKEQGFRFQKWFCAYGPGDGPAGLKKNVEMVRNLREAVGDEVDLMFDAYSGWDLNYALAWAKQVEQYRPRWIEEAFHPEKVQSFATLRRSTSIPVASGEHFYGRWEVHDYLRQGALNVVQADPEWCGGISELVKICTVASLRRPGNPARPCFAHSAAPGCRSIAHDLPDGRVSDQQDGFLPPLREVPAHPDGREGGFVRAPGLRHRARSSQSRKADVDGLELITYPENSENPPAVGLKLLF
jgi:L-alanine-DL-glutamate epimerase-like enolase superfamily enzyme